MELGVLSRMEVEGGILVSPLLLTFNCLIINTTVASRGLIQDHGQTA